MREYRAEGRRRSLLLHHPEGIVTHSRSNPEHGIVRNDRLGQLSRRGAGGRLHSVARHQVERSLAGQEQGEPDTRGEGVQTHDHDLWEKGAGRRIQDLSRSACSTRSR